MQVTEEAFEAQMQRLTEKRRAAMFRAFKQLEMMDRAFAVYECNGEEPPDVDPCQLLAMAGGDPCRLLGLLTAVERSKPRSKWAVQHEFMEDFRRSEFVLAMAPRDACAEYEDNLKRWGMAEIGLLQMVELAEGRFPQGGAL